MDGNNTFHPPFVLDSSLVHFDKLFKYLNRNYHISLRANYILLSLHHIFTLGNLSFIEY